MSSVELNRSDSPSQTPSAIDADRLLDAATAGDQRACEQLLELHRERLKRLLHLRMSPGLAARVAPSDILQESMIEAWKKLPTYCAERPLAFYPWLRQIVIEKLIDQYHHHVSTQKRSTRRETQPIGAYADDSAMALAEHFAADQTSPSGVFARGELLLSVRAAIDSLSEQDREVLIMRHLEQMSVDEVAASLRLTASAVKMRRLRAIQRLREVLEATDV